MFYLLKIVFIRFLHFCSLLYYLGFSLDSWLKDNKIQSVDNIGAELTKSLFSSYSLDKYLQSQQCDINDNKFNALNGQYYFLS